jgi:hypothetical protein
MQNVALLAESMVFCCYWAWDSLLLDRFHVRWINFHFIKSKPRGSQICMSSGIPGRILTKGAERSHYETTFF